MPPSRKNQHKPNPPLTEIEGYIRKYWAWKWNDKRILNEILTKHLDTSQYGLGITRFKEMRKSLGLIRPRQSKYTIADIHPAIQKLRLVFPKAGAREMVSLLFNELNLYVERSLVMDYFSQYERDQVRARKAGRLMRKRFWAAGVNDMFCIDQHDKWKRFGLCLHAAVEPFSGRIIWMKIYWTNSNPRLILSYYLEFLELYKFMPLITQSDPGSENYGIANGHTLLRHWHDRELVRTLQHRWMREKKNIKPEIGWSQLRRRWTPGFENILDLGVLEGWYDPDDTLHVMVFRWVFIPWLQRELDNYTHRVNNTAKRADRNKILPHGIPNHIYESPETYGALDFKVAVQPEAIQYVRGLYAPPDDPVFELVPPTFAILVEQFYDDMGRPEVGRESCWHVYCGLRDRFVAMDDIPEEHQNEWKSNITEARAEGDARDAGKSVDLLPNLQGLAGGANAPRPDGSIYIGGVNGGLGLDDAQNARLDDMLQEDEPTLDDEEYNNEGLGLEVVFSSDEDDGDQW